MCDWLANAHELDDAPDAHEYEGDARTRDIDAPEGLVWLATGVPTLAKAAGTPGGEDPADRHDYQQNARTAIARITEVLVKAGRGVATIWDPRTTPLLLEAALSSGPGPVRVEVHCALSSATELKLAPWSQASAVLTRDGVDEQETRSALQRVLRTRHIVGAVLIGGGKDVERDADAIAHAPFKKFALPTTGGRARDQYQHNPRMWGGEHPLTGGGGVSEEELSHISFTLVARMLRDRLKI